MKQKIIEIWKQTDDVLFRYPMVLTMAFIAAISAVAGIEMENRENFFSIFKLVIIGCLGISLMFGIKMLSQRFGKGLWMEITAVLLLISLYLYLPSKESDFTEVYAFILIPLFILSHLLVSFGPYLLKTAEIRFWQYNKNLFINIVLTAIFTGILVLGVVLAILAVDNLFDLKLDEILYPKTFSFLGIFGSCFIFLLFCSKGLSQLETTTDYPQVLKFFTQFILIPLLIIYLVILYFYSGKILLNWELPRGWVSYLILAYSVVGILALLLVYPLKEGVSRSWVKLFSKIFYYTLVPLLILLFVAINTRILEYGYTEPRYYVLLLAFWLAAVAAYYILAKNASIKFIPLSLFMFGLAALALPYFNAFSVAERSQKAELQKLLQKNGLLENGKINFSKRVSSKIAEEVGNKFNFLKERNNDEYLYSLLNADQKNKIDKINTVNRQDISYTVSSFFTDVITSEHTAKSVRIIAENNIFNTADYDYVAQLSALQTEQFKIGDDTFQLQIIPHKKLYRIKLNEKHFYDLLPYLRKISKDRISKDGAMHVDSLSHEFILNNYQIKVDFYSISVDQPLEEHYYIENGLIFIKKK